MVREIGVHDDDKVARNELQTVHVGGAQTEFAGARLEDDMLCAEGFLEFFGPVEGAVGRGVVDNDDFPI